MTQGISGWRPGQSGPLQPGSLPPTPEGPPLPLPAPPFLPAEPALEPYPLAYPTPLPRLSVPVLTAAASPAQRDAEVGARLDAFYATMNAPYRTAEGLAWPGTTFYMLPGYPAQPPPIAPSSQRSIDAATRTGVNVDGITAGRGTASAIHAVTQALIDQGNLRPAGPLGESLELRVRTMMFAHRIGTDCAGYVQGAYRFATGTDIDFSSPDVAKIVAKGFTRIADASSVRTGDIVILGPLVNGSDPVQHRAIVRAQHLATPSEIDSLRGRLGEVEAVVAGGRVRVFEVDSSWGSGGDAALGGVQRRRWWLNETTGTWGWTADDPGIVYATRDPYNHVFSRPFGFYRGAQSR